MSRPRGLEVPQRKSPRGPQPRTSSSADSDPTVRQRRVTDRKPKLDQNSPRSVQSNPVNKKKLGTRIADVETQLGLAQEELKILKEQLASAEAAKVRAQEQLEKKSDKPSPPDLEEAQEDHVPTERETDVFEVPMHKMSVEFKKPTDQTKPTELEQPQHPTFDDMALKDDEILLLRTKLEEKEKELKTAAEENQTLRDELNEASLKYSAIRAKEEQVTSELNKVEQELGDSKSSEDQLKEKLETVEREKQELEAEMKKMKVQTEQWRKAADAAAAVLSGDAETKGRRISERCGSMDKHIGGSYEPGIGRYRGFVDSTSLGGDDSDDDEGGGKRRGHGMKMFGDLWKKKGHK